MFKLYINFNNMLLFHENDVSLLEMLGTFTTQEELI